MTEKNDGQLTAWGGLTYAEIDAKKAEDVRAANDALQELTGRGCQWWLYSVSHRTFELVVGDAMGVNNAVLSFQACEHIAGPVSWPNQQLRVRFENEQDGQRGWTFELEDASVGFKVAAKVFSWKRNYDLLDRHSLYMPRASRRE